MEGVPDPDSPPLAEVAALVLAAGGSSRFGVENKLLHRWQGRALLEHVVEAIDTSAVARSLVVTGYQHACIDAVLTRRSPPLDSVHNADWASGLASSLVRGVSALQDHPAILVCLGDMPWLQGALIDTLLRAAAQCPERWMVVPVHGGRRGNPVLIRQALYPAVLALQGDAGARVLAARQPERVREVAVETVGVLLDVDTQQDAERLR